MFKKINNAYKILNNSKTREIYDEFGINAAEDYLNGTFNQMKYHLYPGMNMAQKNIRQDKTINITAKLESFYTGTNINFEYKQRKACFECSNCCECKGFKYIEITHDLIINLPAGAEDNYRILFPSIVSYKTNSSPGDLIVYVRQLPHDTFKRMGSDLIIQFNVKLADALCGFIFTINHIDGTQKRIQENQLKNFLETRVVKGLGMQYFPILNEQKETNGDLIIYITVKLPQYKIIKDSHSVIKILFGRGREKEGNNKISKRVNNNRISRKYICNKRPIFKTTKYKKNTTEQSGNKTINECRQM